MGVWKSVLELERGSTKRKNRGCSWHRARASRKAIGLVCAALIFGVRETGHAAVVLSDFETPEQLQPLRQPQSWLEQHPGKWCANGTKLEQRQKHVSRGMFSARATFPEAVTRGIGWPKGCWGPPSGYALL